MFGLSRRPCSIEPAATYIPHSLAADGAPCGGHVRGERGEASWTWRCFEDPADAVRAALAPVRKVGFHQGEVAAGRIEEQSQRH